jgi:hypothetical protein
MAVRRGISERKMNSQKGGFRMKTMKVFFVLLLIAGLFLFTGQSSVQGSGGGEVPWEAIQINNAPRSWADYRGGELSILFGRFDASSAFAGDTACPEGVIVTKMSFALKLKVDGFQQAYSQVRDVVICSNNYDGQWEELKNFLNEVVISAICGTPGVWGPYHAGGTWVITKLLKPAAGPDVFMAEIDIAVQCLPPPTAR